MAIKETIQWLPEQNIPWLGKAAVWMATSIAKNKMKNAANNWMPKNAIEQTWWWYNYYLPWSNGEQGQVNALNWTWHVAWFPVWPSTQLIEPLQTEAPVEPVTNTTPKPTPVKPAAPQQEVNPNAVYDESWSYLGSKDIVEAPQQQEPEVVEEIPNQEFGEEQPAWWWYIYGRELGTDSNWADFKFGEETLADPYSVEAKMYTSRRNNYNALQAMWSYEVAALIVAWLSPYGDQAMFDLQTYNPEKYQQIQDYVKELRAEDTVNALSHWSAWIWDTFVETTETSIKNSQDSWINQNSTDRSKSDVTTMLDTRIENNQTATTAKQQMMQYKSDIVDLQYEIDDLENQAKKIFKWDTPDYLVKAWMSNRQQELQAKMDKLESKFNAMSDIYKTELSHEQRAVEMELKYRQEARQQAYQEFDMWYKTAQLEQNQVQRAKDSQWNMKAYKIVNWQIVQIDDGTAYQWYQTTVSSLVDQANKMAEQKNYPWWQCEEFTDNMAQKAAWVRMVWTSAWWETTAAEKAWYATQFWTFSDYIPEIWDVAVFTNNGSNWVSEKRWHTMYVTWYDPTTWIISMVWSNQGWNELVYSKQYSLQEFYNKGWQWFRNPYKYAQWTASIQNQTSYSDYSPMQPVIDAKMEWASISQLANLWTFQEIYTELYKWVNEWQLDALLKQWAVWAFLQELAVFYNNRWNTTTSGWANKAKDTSLWWLFSLTITELGKEIENYLAQNAWNYSEEAYMWFLKILRAVEIKLRDESWAAINDSERATNFLEYLPKPSDSKANKKEKMFMMEEYVRRLGTTAWINSKEYIKLFGNGSSSSKRSID